MTQGKTHPHEQIVNVLRQIEAAIANGKTTTLACKNAGVTEQTYYRWRKKYRGLEVDQAKWLKFLTNNFNLPPLAVTEICKNKWAVELFFRWIKQHLRI